MPFLFVLLAGLSDSFCCRKFIFLRSCCLQGLIPPVFSELVSCSCEVSFADCWQETQRNAWEQGTKACSIMQHMCTQIALNVLSLFFYVFLGLQWLHWAKDAVADGNSCDLSVQWRMPQSISDTVLQRHPWVSVEDLALHLTGYAKLKKHAFFRSLCFCLNLCCNRLRFWRCK